MRITSKGQVTIPLEIRQELGLQPHTQVAFEVVGKTVRIRKAGGGESRGAKLLARLKGRGAGRLSTDEILALTRG
jgi:AbrB family looped-hinge helix DNA binding protein